MKTLLDVEPDGSVKGLTVVGFHGYVEADETPAKLGPVYVDAAGCHARIVEVGPTRRTPAGKIRIETFSPPFPKEGPLPGDGTRAGPWPARLGDLIMAVGPEEHGLRDALLHVAQERGKGRVAQFVAWLAGDELRSDGLRCERQEGIALWYCGEEEGFSLLECVHHVVRDVFFDAVRSHACDAIEDAAWWLSRAAIADQDIYLAGAALRWVASPTWQLLIREGLHLPDEADWKEGLAEAQRHLDHPPPVLVATSAPYRNRDAVRRCFFKEPKAA